jgi:tetratricopeptide (TPR) repeat protein
MSVSRDFVFFLVAAGASAQIGGFATQARSATQSLQQGRYADAEKQFQEALVRCETSNCAELPDILNGLAGLFYEVGRYREAEPLLRRAIEMLKPDSDDKLLTAALSNLAAVCHVRGRLAEAQSLYAQAQSLQGNGPSVEASKLLARRALLAQDMGDPRSATELIQNALEGLTQSGSTETAEGAAVLATWAAIFEAQGNPEKAEEELKLALAIRERISGPDHMSVADALNTLGVSYSHRSRWVDAERSLRRSVAILRMYPPSPALAASMNNLGSALRAQGRGKESESWIRQAIATWELLLGPNHPNVAAGLTNLAVSLQARGRYAEAAPLMERALKIDEGNFPASHVRIGIDLSRAGALAKARKHYSEAEDLLRRADEILEGRLPATDQEIGAALLNLGDVLSFEKKFELSAKMYQRGLAVAYVAWGPQDARLAPWLDGYANVLRQQQHFAEAERVEAQATKLRVTQILGAAGEPEGSPAGSADRPKKRSVR